MIGFVFMRAAAKRILPPNGAGRERHAAIVREYRKQRFELAVARHGGRLVKLTGEGSDLRLCDVQVTQLIVE
jgi:hypothetical protein